MPITAAELERRFSHHKVDDRQRDQMEDIRSIAHRLAQAMWRMAPDSRELSLAITNIEQAVFWANAAVARKEGT